MEESLNERDDKGKHILISYFNIQKAFRNKKARDPQESRYQSNIRSVTSQAEVRGGGTRSPNWTDHGFQTTNLWTADIFNKCEKKAFFF